MIEKVFLGCLMKANYLIKDTIVRPEFMEDIRHRLLLERMKEFDRNGKAIDLITMTTVKDIDQLGGISYLADIETYADLDNFEKTEDLIIDGWKEREKRNILNIGALNDWEIDKVVQELEKIKLLRANDHTTIYEALAEIYEAPWQDPKPETMVKTGITKLDDMTGGFKAGELVIIAARPSMGKTDVMLHFAKKAGWSGYLPIIFSLEMPTKAIINRLVASTGKINRVKLRNPKIYLNEKQKESWPKLIGIVEKTKIQLFDQPGQTIAEMRSKIRKMIHEYPDRKPVVFIDYLTLIRPTETYGGNAHFQVTEISRNLKAMAKDFNCPVICLAQLNRNVESRANKRPVMSDIRESGSIEQDADLILFLYREKYYELDTTNQSLEMIIAKNRNGPIGKVTVTYYESTGRIEDFGERNAS